MRVHLLLPAAVVALAATTVAAVGVRAPDAGADTATATPVLAEAVRATAAAGIDLDVDVARHDHPPRSVVTDPDGAWLATFTDGAHTVAVAGEERTFDEPSADAGVTTDVWVRLLDAPFDGDVDLAWLRAALDDREPDVLEIATEYFEGAPDVRDEDGALIAGEAEYGPLLPDGWRPVGADWHDFPGVDATYGSKVDPADPEEYRALDCSGYVRIVYGFRLGLPLTLRPDGGASLPRRSFEQAAEAPGVVPIADGELDEARLQTGDLVFFDAPDDGDDRIDHVGIHLGVDDDGHHRFIHSRRSSNGPTLGGDAQGPSILDGEDYFARGFVSTRRL
ncbi:C40 family peptidase [Egicoccus sp. AB-alg2]|uniref:C40 family peptidase n=1 Tax=Egicoccus sp. AB-alg2 TaxID=3242693 RepID=UPI00359D1F68